MKKNNSKGNSSANKASAGDVSQVQFWNYLKKGDDEGLEKTLLQRVENSETGEVTVVVNSAVANQLVNSPNAKKILPLSYAISQGMSERGLHALLLAGAKIDAMDGTSERATALHAACWGENDSAVMLLLRCGANPLAVDSQGRTPLHVLASLNAISLFSLVLETVTKSGVDQNTCRGDDTEQRLEGHLSLEGHSPVIVPSERLLDSRDNAGLTVLHTAVSDISSGSDGVISKLLSYLEEMAKTSADKVSRLVNMTTDSESTALHLILSWPNCDEGVMMHTVERLLKLGASASAVDKYGQTAVTVAVTTHVGITVANVVRSLLRSVEEGEDNEARLKNVFMQCDNEKGYALIHHAVAANNIEVVKVLVNFLGEFDGASGSQYIRHWLGGLLTDNNETVVQLIVEYGCDEIADLLIGFQAINKIDYEKYKEEHEKIREDESVGNLEDGDIDSNEEGGHEIGDEVGLRGRQFAGRSTAAGASSGGSRIQLARRARARAQAQSAAQRKKDAPRQDSEVADRQRNAVPLLVMLCAVLIFIASAALVGFTFRNTIVSLFG